MEILCLVPVFVVVFIHILLTNLSIGLVGYRAIGGLGGPYGSTDHLSKYGMFAFFAPIMILAYDVDCKLGGLDILFHYLGFWTFWLSICWLRGKIEDWVTSENNKRSERMDFYDKCKGVFYLVVLLLVLINAIKYNL